MRGIGTAGVREGAGRNNAHLATGTVFLPVNLPLLILLIDITLEFENVIQPGEKLDFPLLITRTGRPARLGQTFSYKTPRGKPKRSCRSKELSSWVWTRMRNKTSSEVRGSSVCFSIRTEVKLQSYHFRLLRLLAALPVLRVFNVSVYYLNRGWETALQLKARKEAILGTASPINKRPCKLDTPGRESTVTRRCSPKVSEGISAICCGELPKRCDAATANSSTRCGEMSRALPRHGAARGRSW